MSSNHSNETSFGIARTFPKCEDIHFSFFYWRNNESPAELMAALIIMALGFSGNVVTVAVVSCWKELHTPTFTMIACLAVSDAYSLLQHFVWHYTVLSNVWFYAFCVNNHRVYDISRILTVYIGRFNAGFHLGLLAFLRYIAVVHPLKFKTYFSPKKVILTSVCGWIIVLLFSTFCTLMVFYRRHIFYTRAQYWDYRASISSLNFVIPTLLFITLHCLKMRALRRSPALNKNTSRKMTIVITIIILIYVGSSASIALGQFHILFFGKINTLAFIISCAVNPFIYFVSSAPMVRIYRRIATCCCTVTSPGEPMALNDCPPRWRRGSGLDCGSEDPGSIPGIPSPHGGPLMASR